MTDGTGTSKTVDAPLPSRLRPLMKQHHTWRPLSETGNGCRRTGRTRRQNSSLSSRVSDLERQLADRDRELATLRAGSSERERLSSQLASAQSDRDRLAAELAAANRRIADFERQVAEARAAQAAAVHTLESARQGLVRSLRPQIAKGDIAIDLNSERLLINMASNDLFDSGQDQLKPGGVEALKKVGEALKDYPEYTVSVEGHTDNRPLRSSLKKKFASNQELSEARAVSAAKALAEGGLTSVATAGRADTQPVASNNTEAGRAQNRRVEIIVK